MGLALSTTNVIGFTKSSKGARETRWRRVRCAISSELTRARVRPCAEAKAEISAGVSRFATQYMRSSILG